MVGSFELSNDFTFQRRQCVWQQHHVDLSCCFSAEHNGLFLTLGHENSEQILVLHEWRA